MKFALKSIIFPLTIGLLTVSGCNPYDDSELSARVDDLENRVDVLEDRLDEFQTSVDECVTLVNQFKAEKRIKDFKEDPNGNGYIIEFVDGKTMHIKNGEVPELSVIFDETLQEYVWTANGEVVMDKTTGEPVRAYIAPEFEVRDGKLGYTLGGEWHEVTNGETVGLIADVLSNDEGVTFVLSSGSSIFIPKVGFRLNIGFFEYGAPAGKTVNIEYSLTDADENAEILIYPDEGFTVVDQGWALEVTLPAEEEKAYSGKVLVMAVNGNGATSAKVIRFGTLVTEVTSAEVIKVSRHGGVVSINVKSNRPYNAMIQSDPITFIPPDWLLPVENPSTKAAREDVLYYEVLPMPEDLHEDREATVRVEWMTNIKEEQDDFENFEKYIVRKDIVIMQLDTKDVEVDKIMDKTGGLYTYDMYWNIITDNGQLDGSLPGAGLSVIVEFWVLMKTLTLIQVS